jgi:hypothetical protein
MSKWRDTYKVHPAADVFPMMTDAELADLGEDIRANGLTSKLTFFVVKPEWGAVELGDGRNRIEALERAGIELTDAHAEFLPGLSEAQKVAFIISKNIKRRHLTKQQQADLIVAAIKASRQVGEVPPKRHTKGKAGSEKDATKEAAVKAGAEHGIGKRTIERALGKKRNEGKSKPKPKAEPKPKPSDRRLEAAERQRDTALAEAAEVKRNMAELEDAVAKGGIDAARARYALAYAQLQPSDRSVEMERLANALREAIAHAA